MPLSEHEQEMLAQMEQALASEDPRFATQMRTAGLGGLRRRRLLIGAVGLLAGLGLVLLGVNTTMWIGVVGFAIMVAAVAYALTPPKTIDDQPPTKVGGPGGPGKRGPKGGDGSGFMHKLDERWERRERGH